MKDAQLKKMQLVEKYAKWAWPIHRLFVKKYLSARCKTCLVTAKYSPFENGICKECREFKANFIENKQGADEKLTNDLHELLKKTHSIDGKYDALLLLSGGKDSAYLLQRLVTEHPHLKILAFT